MMNTIKAIEYGFCNAHEDYLLVKRVFYHRGKLLVVVTCKEGCLYIYNGENITQRVRILESFTYYGLLSGDNLFVEDIALDIITTLLFGDVYKDK